LSLAHTVLQSQVDVPFSQDAILLLAKQLESTGTPFTTLVYLQLSQYQHYFKNSDAVERGHW
jgi:hypothetical protein